MPSPSSRKSSPPEWVERFTAALPADPRIVRKPMFGYPAAFAEGNLVCSLYQDAVVVRLGKDGAARAVAEHGARQFAPMPGRTMTGYVLVPPTDAEQQETLATWLRQALDFTLTLPKKAPAKSPR